MVTKDDHCGSSRRAEGEMRVNEDGVVGREQTTQNVVVLVKECYL